MKYLYLCICVSVMVLFFACDLEPFDNNKETLNPEETKITEESTLFTFDNESNVYVFETNDKKYLTQNGYTLWTMVDTNSGNSFNKLNVEVIKESGRSEAGFGIIFCRQEINEKDFMLTVLINSEGLYTIGKVAEGVFSHINDGWKSSSYINKGLGIKNKLEVSYDEGSHNFNLSINGYFITAFTVSEEISFTNAGSGFAAVISANENFPETTVKVTFEKK